MAPRNLNKEADAYMQNLKLQAKLASDYNDAVQELKGNVKLGITPVAPPYQSESEKASNFTQQYQILKDNLKTVVKDPNEVERFLDGIKDIQALNFVNNNWADIAEKLKGRSTIDAVYLRTFLQRYANARTATDETGITQPFDVNRFLVKLQSVMAEEDDPDLHLKIEDRTILRREIAALGDNVNPVAITDILLSRFRDIQPEQLETPLTIQSFRELIYNKVRQAYQGPGTTLPPISTMPALPPPSTPKFITTGKNNRKSIFIYVYKKENMGLPERLKAWTEHLNKFRKEHPKLSLKQAMQQAKKTYKKAVAAPAA